MSKNIARRWNQSFASMRSDERGAEATEVIFILVIVVLGLAAAFVALRGKLVTKTEDIGKCVAGVGGAAACP
jgi:Flp pilus assembly pilin Flp